MFLKGITFTLFRLMIKECLNMYNQILSILETEVKPALGCTGPTSVSYTASVAKDAVGGDLESVKILVDRDTYKNSISVGIPGTSERGVVIAAALGAVAGDSKLGLEVLNGITKEDERKANELIANEKVELDINWDIKGIGLYIEVFVTTDKGTGHAIVTKTHTNVVLIEVNNEIIYKDEKTSLTELLDESKSLINKYGTKDFYEFAMNIPIEKIHFLNEAINMNKKLAEEGFKDTNSIGFGLGLSNINSNNSTMKAKAYTAAASDARMKGYNLPAMSCASSGNVGITASLPLYIIGTEDDRTNESILRALSLSFLLTIFIKNQIGRLSAMCACAIAASVGVSAGTVLLSEGTFEQVENAIKNVVGSIGGVVCDGAKLGCALKLSSSVGVAIESAQLSMNGVSIPDGDGLVCDTADETLRLLGRIAKLGMIETDIQICREIINREKQMTR